MSSFAVMASFGEGCGTTSDAGGADASDEGYPNPCFPNGGCGTSSGIPNGSSGTSSGMPTASSCGGICVTLEDAGEDAAPDASFDATSPDGATDAADSASPTDSSSDGETG